MIYSRIIGTGSYLPKKVLTNLDLAKMVETSDEWITERTGIKERHIAADHETASSMGLIAAKKSIEAAGIPNHKIDLIIVATSTPDYIFPSTANLLQKELAIPDCPAFDITAACAGFNYALSVADNFIKTGSAKCALVIGSEIMSRIIDWTDRTTCILFADGAGAVLLVASSEPGIFSTHLHSEGKYKDLLYTPIALPVKGKIPVPHMKMKGPEVFKVAVNCLGDAVLETLEANQMQQSDVDWLVPHQANLRIIQAIAKKLKLPMEKIVVTLDRHGNTSAASVPLALDEAIRDGRIKRGDNVMLESFGGGFTWGSALLRY